MAFGLQLVPAEHHLHGMSRALQRGRKLPVGLGTAKGKPQGAVLPSAPHAWPSGPCLHPHSSHLPELWKTTVLATQILAHIHLNQAPRCRGWGKAPRWDEAAKKEHLLFPLHSGCKQALTLCGPRTTFGVNFC